MATLRLSFILITLVVCIGATFGCTCFPSHPQQQFCDSDFVIKGQVLGSFVQGYQRVYKVLVIAKYKCRFGLNLTPGSIQFISTALSGAACGVHLRVGEKYVLSGTFSYPGGLQINACGFNRLCRSLSKCQLDNLISGRYAANCACQVSVCFPGSPFCPVPKCGCVSTSPSHEDSVCVKHFGFKCYWQRFC